MDTAQHQHHHHELPPSPPPSPPAVRKRPRKKLTDDDPFFNLDLKANPLLTSSPPSSPTTASAEPKENIFIRLLYTPLLTISFLLSLALLSLLDRSRRLTSSPSSTSTSNTTRPSLLARLNPEPYQSTADSTWAHQQHSNSDGANPRSGRQESWHLHKKIRKLARLEIGDALEMRGKVAMGLCVVAVVGCVVVYWVVGWVWGFLRGWGR